MEEIFLYYKLKVYIKILATFFSEVQHITPPEVPVICHAMSELTC